MRLWSKLDPLLLAVALLLAVPASRQQPVSGLAPRALADAPDGYAPKKGPCPSDSLIRNARSLSNGEQDFLTKRHQVADAALKDFLGRADMQDFDANSFIDSYSPTVALAFSGGGYRAMLSGAGAVKAMDIRTPGANGRGQVGGLLQSATYFSGLSGGSWLLGSVFLNNFTTIADLQASKDVWDFTNSILTPDGILGITDNAEYYNAINGEVTSKVAEGFGATLTDYWARALSRQFLDWPNGGPGVTYSSIAKTDQYRNAEIPFPVIVADGRYAGEKIISLNATVYEFNPLEFGSFDPTLYAFTPLEYLGTNMTNGKPTGNDQCVRGFDNSGFVMGTSSSLFNQLIMQLGSSGLGAPLRKLVQGVLTTLSNDQDDIANYAPNPFFGVYPESNPTAYTRNLTLVDGGEDLQNIPLHPLIQPPRKVDVIFAFDNSADTLNNDGSTSNWPNGTALVASYERARNGAIANGTLFPPVPDTNTFVNLGLNHRPTFFGCQGSNTTRDHPDGVVPPLLVYIPNTPWSFTSNTSTTQMAYSHSQRDKMINNGYNIASQGNGTLASGWPACIGCAIIHREIERRNATHTEQCRNCLANYCWNGTVMASRPPEYKPALLLKTSGAGRAFAAANGVAFLAAAATLLTMGLMTGL